MTYIETIINYFQEYGWKTTLAENGSVVARFLAEKSNVEFNLLAQVSEHWVGLTVFPYLPPFTLERRSEFAQYICHSNLEIKFARLAQTDKDETVLCLDLPTSCLTEDLFRLALDVMVYYADTLYPDLVHLYTR